MDRARMLIVDDDPGMRLLLRAVAEDAGCVVVAEAADGREAVEQARAHEPDLVVMDLSMPVMDGVEATARITGAQPQTAVVAWTSSEDDADRERALAAGARTFLHKGHTDALIAALRAI